MTPIIRIGAIGDISLSSGKTSQSTLLTIDSEIIKKISSYDILIANLECVFYPAGKEKDQDLSTLLIEKDSSFSDFLKIGTSAVSLANNHILDFNNSEGLIHTITLLEQNQIRYFGAGKNIAEAKKPAIYETKEKRIGLIGRMECSFFNPKIIYKMGATENLPGVALLDWNSIQEEINIIKKKYNLDFLILYVHWGVEHIHTTHPFIHKMATNLLKNSDIDIIIGSHAHCIQGIIKTKTKVLCFGLGNFFFYPKTIQNERIFNDIKNSSLSLLIELEIYYLGIGVDTFVLEQNQENKIIFKQKNIKKIKNKIFNKWAKYSQTAFFISILIFKIVTTGKKILKITNNSYYQQKIIQWLINPKLFLQSLKNFFRY